MAPEMLTHEFDAKCDIWSLGIILYVMLSGISPYAHSSENSVQISIKTEAIKLDGPEWDCVSDVAKDLLLKMLSRDPKKRISAS